MSTNQESKEELKVSKADIHSEAAALLLSELSGRLNRLTGSSGEASFSLCDVEEEKSIFVIAMLRCEPAGCGAIRKVCDSTGEVKRMYARENGHGTGTAILTFLEEKAREFGYNRLICETRKINTVACSFYIRNGYSVIPNYGKYQGRDEAVCFEKVLRN